MGAGQHHLDQLQNRRNRSHRHGFQKREGGCKLGSWEVRKLGSWNGRHFLTSQLPNKPTKIRPPCPTLVLFSSSSSSTVSGAVKSGSTSRLPRRRRRGSIGCIANRHGPRSRRPARLSDFRPVRWAIPKSDI